jgi:hypothetical protein
MSKSTKEYRPPIADKTARERFDGAAPAEAEGARTPLGRRLLAIRERIVRSGAPLLGWDQIEQEVAARRGGAGPSDPAR